MRRLLVTLGVVGLFAALTVAITWPQAAQLRTHVAPFDDSLLSIWRISWIAHALTSAAPLVNANIFHPELRTLAYTDAVLLQGLVAAPFIRGGASPVMVYNLLILGSIALSGAAMCLLAQRLTGSLASGIVAGTIFAFVTFRFDHFMHLELQATIFLPLAVWCLDRAFESGRWRDMAGFGASLVLQVLSGIYYAVFLATALAVAIPWRWMSLPPDRRLRFAKQIAVVALVSGVVAAPYLAIYMQNRSSVGERADGEVRLYSATPLNYLSSDPANVLHGPWSERLGRNERRLFPGFLAFGLAAYGLWGWSSRKSTVVIIGVVGFVLSLGLNTPIYVMLRELVFTYRGLRAPARAAALVYLALAVLAAYGWRAVLARRPQWTTVGTAVLVGLLFLEYLTLPTPGLALPRPSRRGAVAGAAASQRRRGVAAPEGRRTPHDSRRHVHVRQHLPLAAAAERLQRVLSAFVHRVDRDDARVPVGRSHCVFEATRGRSHRPARHLHEARRARGLGRGAERAAGHRGGRGVPGVRGPGYRVQTEPLHTRVNGTAISPVRANAASTTPRCVAASWGGPTGVPRPKGTISVRGAASRDEISGITESITVAMPRASSAEATRLTVW